MRSIALAMAAYVCLWCTDAAATEPDVCSLLTQQQISAAFGVAVGTGTPSLSSPACKWSGADKIVTLSITRTRGAESPVDQFYSGKALSLPGMAVQPVTGVGDAAYYVYFAGKDRDGCHLMVKKNRSVFEVRVDGFDLDHAKVVAKTLAQAAADEF
ncbi:MAG TPA: DUF3558 family protein [Pseudomonadales bacterium]|nr:DUF3558 family protein [Pseudomonadales bacterium]